MIMRKATILCSLSLLIRFCNGVDLLHRLRRDYSMFWPPRETRTRRQKSQEERNERKRLDEANYDTVPATKRTKRVRTQDHGNRLQRNNLRPGYQQNSEIRKEARVFHEDSRLQTPAKAIPQYLQESNEDQEMRQEKAILDDDSLAKNTAIALQRHDDPPQERDIVGDNILPIGGEPNIFAMEPPVITSSIGTASP